jgi:hypothetical protein
MTPRTFKDEWVFDIALRDGKLGCIHEYIDTQALAGCADGCVRPQSEQLTTVGSRGHTTSKDQGDPYVRPIEAI